MTKITVKQALNMTVEDIAVMPLASVQEVADVLGSSKDKKARRKLDLVIGTLNARKKEARETQDKDAEKEVKAVENSVKKTAKESAPQEELQEELQLDEPAADEPAEDEPAPAAPAADEPAADEPAADEPAPAAPAAKPVKKKKKKPAEKPAGKVKPKKKPADKKSNAAKEDADEVKKIKARIAELERENQLLKLETFPETIERKGSAPLERVEMENLQEIQQVLMQRPYELMMYVHEGIDDKTTAFTVLYVNESILVLLDRSREANTVLPVDMKNVKKTSMSISQRECPYAFYLPADADEE